jgi:translation initiation factor IF-1
LSFNIEISPFFINFGWKKFYGIGACTHEAGRYDGPLLKMSECETILLDAQLEAVIDNHAFRAVLGNGHRFTAYVAVRDREKKVPGNGDLVKVEMSPYNMGVGQIII